MLESFFKKKLYNCFDKNLDDPVKPRCFFPDLKVDKDYFLFLKGFFHA